ncbi:hypothetical protein QYF61_002454 [Mycteria americana]|uniref:Uncharacterized protein n=1 Tax=Mycteria americana TaxID=33587 RepID=A0AAN7S1X9_MYCAM|nr:hypothetical protein QYF61_002454 [Mycteria americana]
MLAQSFCLHPNLLQLPSADIKVNSVYGLFVVLATFGLHLLSIILSYAVIIKTVLSITSKEERVKALDTCISYLPLVGLSMVYRLEKPASSLIHVLVANIYLLVPPLLNPIIYMTPGLLAVARPGQLLTQEPEEAFVNGLVFHAVDDGVQHRQDKRVDVGHERVAEGCGILPVPVYNGQADHGDIEDEDNTEVSDISVEGFGLLLSGGDAHHGLNDHGVVGVGQHVELAERPLCEQADEREQHQRVADHPCLCNPGTGEDGGVPQHAADGQAVIQGHGQKHQGLHEGEDMDAEHLGEADREAEPKDMQHGGQGGQSQAQMCQSRDKHFAVPVQSFFLLYFPQAPHL